MIEPAAVTRPGVGDLSLRHGMRLVSDERHVGGGPIFPANWRSGPLLPIPCRRGRARVG